MAFGQNISTFFDGAWHEGNLPIMGAADHGTWMGTMVFDGARTFEGVSPDLDLHCQRIVRSAKAMGMEAPVTAEELQGLIEERIKTYAPNEELYLRPMMWSSEGLPGMITPTPGDTKWAICIEDLPMPDPSLDFSLTTSPFRRPRQDMAVTEAKAACLYANNGRIMRDARARGFMNAVSLDVDDNVAETASTNIFTVKGGEVFTPVPNGTFLAGITRMRIIELLRSAGLKVHETSMTLDDLQDVEEMFLTGNASKVTGVTQYEDTKMQVGRITRMAREAYWDYAHQAA